MNISFFATEQKIGFTLDADGNIYCHGLQLNHGIIGLGMLKKFEEKNLDMDLWYKFISSLNRKFEDRDDPRFSKFEEYIRLTRTLSFNQSAVCARAFVVQHIAREFKVDEIICEITSLQEGHISSIWRVDIKTLTGAYLERFVLNISRDFDSGNKLKQLSEMIIILRQRYQDIHFAQVYSIWSLDLDYYDTQIEVIVTSNEYIENAKNIYYREDNEFGNHQYYLADRFIVSDNKPTGPTKEILAKEAPISINIEINEIVNRICLNDVDSVFPVININRGDLVWDGERVVVVGLS